MTCEGIVYNFTAKYPPNGFCESQQGYGRLEPPFEPRNLAFCLLSCVFGVIGMIHSKPHMSTPLIYLYALSVGYGITKAMAHALLMNGLDKIAEILLKFLQARIIGGFAASLRNISPFSKWPHYVLGVILCTAGIYPAVSIVLSSSSESDWVGFLTFDGIWAIVLLEVLIIWKKRDQYDVQQPDIFKLIWYATGSVILAYICWLLDYLACCPLVVLLCIRGWWYIFLALGFYHCIVLIAYLIASAYNYKPVATFWPSEKLILLATVKWVNYKAE